MYSLKHLNKTTNVNKTNNNNNVNVLKDFKAEAGKAKSAKQGNDPQIYVVFISLLLDLLAFTIILPLLPSLLEYFKQNDNSVFYRVLTQSMQKFQQLVGAPERFNSVLFGGFLGSMFSFLQFLASPIVGGLSDYYGRRPVLICCAVSIFKYRISLYNILTICFFFFFFRVALLYHISYGHYRVILLYLFCHGS